jgi:hypothetical protein
MSDQRFSSGHLVTRADDLDSRVRERVGLVEKARRLHPTLEHEGLTDREIKLQAVGKVMKADLATASDDHLAGVFETLATQAAAGRLPKMDAVVDGDVMKQMRREWEDDLRDAWRTAPADAQHAPRPRRPYAEADRSRQDSSARPSSGDIMKDARAAWQDGLRDAWKR